MRRIDWSDRSTLLNKSFFRLTIRVNIWRTNHPTSVNEAQRMPKSETSAKRRERAGTRGSKTDLITAIKILINPPGLWAFYSRSRQQGFHSTLWSASETWELSSRCFISSYFKTHPVICIFIYVNDFRWIFTFYFKSENLRLLKRFFLFFRPLEPLHPTW